MLDLLILVYIEFYFRYKISIRYMFFLGGEIFFLFIFVLEIVGDNGFRNFVVLFFWFLSVGV